MRPWVQKKKEGGRHLQDLSDSLLDKAKDS